MIILCDTVAVRLCTMKNTTYVLKSIKINVLLVFTSTSYSLPIYIYILFIVCLIKYFIYALLILIIKIYTEIQKERHTFI